MSKRELYSQVIKRWKPNVPVWQTPDWKRIRSRKDRVARAAVWDLLVFMESSVAPGPFRVPKDMQDWDADLAADAAVQYFDAYLTPWERYARFFLWPPEDSKAAQEEMRPVIEDAKKFARRIFWSLYIAEKGGYSVPELVAGLYMDAAVKSWPRDLLSADWERYFAPPF